MVTRPASIGSYSPVQSPFATSEYQGPAAAQINGGRVNAHLPEANSEGCEREIHMPPMDVELQASGRSPAAVTDLVQRSLSLPAAAAPREAVVEQTSVLPANYLGLPPILGFLKFDEIVTIAKQSLEILAEIQDPIYLNPLKMIYEPRSRKLSITSNPAIYFSQFVGGPFYLSPEMILGGTPASTTDTWSLGCILFELLTGEPLFVSGQLNIMLHQMASQIGMPPRSFLQHCENSQMFFSLEPQVQFREPLQIAFMDWKTRVWLSGTSKGVPQKKIEGFIQLLEKMVSYQNRWPAHILLGDPLFQDDIRVYLPHNLSIGDKIFIYRASEMETRQYQPTSENPSYCTYIDGSRIPIPTFVHLPRDPFNQYFIVVERNGVQFPPDRLRLMNGYMLGFVTEDPSETNPTPPA